MRRAHWAILSAAAVGAASCGSGTAADSIRPRETTYAEATQAKQCVGEVSGQSVTPLLVDWRPEERGDLEVAMKQGLVVVHYDCTTLRVLTECAVDGSYGFIGMTTKQQLMRLESADELKANLPLTGSKLAADLGADLQRGSTLDIALVMIGKHMTTRSELNRNQLRGRCEGATHFVRGVTVGAFATETGTQAALRTVASVFGASASAQSSSGKRARNQDGMLDACATATPDAPRAPSQCGAPLRAQLAPIDAKSTSPDGSDAETCPAGLLRTEGKCAPPMMARERAHDCNWTAAECEHQCELGNATSCARAGWMYTHAYNVPPDDRRGVELLTRGCNGGSADGCSSLGAAVFIGKGVAKDIGRALSLFSRACNDGSPIGCSNLARMHYDGIETAKDRARALALWERSCNAGFAPACSGVGLCLVEGDCGAPIDRSRAHASYERACQGGYEAGCVDAKRTP